MIRTHDDSTRIWTAFQQGERQAERQVFQHFFKPLCLYAERITGQLEAAEDIVAESFVKAWDRRQDFLALDNCKAFLYRVVRNASINFAIATRQHRQAHLNVAYIESQEKEAEPALQREILRVELLQEIYAEMENLPGRCGEIFKLIFIHGKSTEEIGALLNINPQTVRTQKARAIQLIKTQLLRKNRISAFLLLMTLVGTS
jgi:RNA polymerase sigma-70 factor (ECF subfamily)